MKKYTLLILIVFGLMAADPASAWFWEKSKVKSPAASSEVKKEKKEVHQKKGFWADFFDTTQQMGRDIGRYFKGVGKDVGKSASEVPGAAGKEAKEVGKSLKDTAKNVGHEAKKGGKAVGKGFKELGHDIKDATKSVFSKDSRERSK